MRHSRRRSGLRLAVAAGLAVPALVAAGCGGDDKRSEPRPPVPFEVSAMVNSEAVNVSPSKFGAGLATWTISNQSENTIQLAVEGPTEAVSEPVEPEEVSDQLKMPMEPGAYEVSVGVESEVQAAELTIGPERKSSSNDLLIP
jgi:hypothetical protein